MSEVIIRDYSGGYEGKAWLERHLQTSLPEFAGLIADILGYAWRGIYHLPARAYERAHWKDRMVEIVIPEGLATWDSPRLTELVILCHAACVRFEVSAAAHRYLRLQFWPRARTGSIPTRHPTLREAVHQLEIGLGVRPKGDEAAA